MYPGSARLKIGHKRTECEAVRMRNAVHDQVKVAVYVARVSAEEMQRKQWNDILLAVGLFGMGAMLMLSAH